ncbi:MAG: YihY family inner membrane protein [Gemmatimonadetes bacterium]|nr:YihY family inner membrane protein [Gemmatimonadota bacterium]
MLLSIYENQVMFLASALAFDALLAALPFCVLVLAALGYVMHGLGMSLGDVHAVLDRFFPTQRGGGADAFARIDRFARTVAENRNELSIYALPFFLWFSTRFYTAVRNSLNEIFDIEETRPFLVGLATDFLLVITTTALFVGNSLLSAETFLTEWVPRFSTNFSAFGFAAVLFFLVYSIAPARRIRWDTALVAALVAALGFELAKKLYVLYLEEFATIDQLVSNANLIALVLFLLWLYATACAFLIGGEVAETYDLAKKQRKQRAILT